ncbi:flavin reductase family protein [Geodermatophilus maliterrae]|uniref:Flavin reductase family protein n=1 Tax=Geodermatophilus maliterrae TaxID=3162531 RepID=A0ABV3XA44_9ACTN
MTRSPGREVPVKPLSVVRRQRRVVNEQNELRAVMSQFATGVTVLTAGGDGAHGMTANAFTSVSLTPPMVLCCVSRAARMHASILAAQSFGVSILGADQTDTARWFADWRRPAGMAQFASIDHRIGKRTGAPLLTGALAWVECRLHQVHEGGDHSVFLGRVVDCSRGQSSAALSFFDGGYHRIGPATQPTTRARGAS